MKSWFRAFLDAIGFDRVSETMTAKFPHPKPTISAQLKTGQVWCYKTRPGEEVSRVVIGKIEELSEPSTVIHVKLTGLRLKNPSAPGGVSSVMYHVPVTEAQLAASVKEVTNEPADLEGFSEGYDNWLAAFRAAEAGVFSISLAEIAEAAEETLNQRIDRRDGSAFPHAGGAKPRRVVFSLMALAVMNWSR